MSKLVVFRGQSIKWRFTISADGAPFDLTGITWNIVHNDLNITLICTVINAVAGILEVTSSYINTQTLKPAISKVVRLQGITLLNQEAFIFELPLIDVR